VKQAFAAAHAMMRGWRHEVIRTLGNSLWAYRGVLALLGMTAVGWIALAASAPNAVGARALQGAGLQQLLLLATFNLVLALTTVMTVGLLVLVPEETAFGTLMATMPMRPALRRLALDGAVIVFALSGEILVSAPFIWLSVSAVHSAGAVTAIVICWFALAVCGVMLGLALFRATTQLICWIMRLPRTLARAAAALVIIGVVGQQSLGNAFIRNGKPQLQQALTPLARAAVAQPAFAILAALGVTVLSIGAWWCAANLGGNVVRTSGVRLVGPLAGALHPRPRRLITLELVQLVRHPANLSTLLILGGGAIAAVVWDSVRSALLWPLGAGLLLGIGSVLFVSSYGSTWTHHWVFRTASARPAGWVPSKWLAATGLWLGVLVSLSAVFMLTPLWNARLAFELVPQLLPAFGISMLVGLVIPVSDEQPLSSVTAVAVSGVAGIGLAIAVSKIAGGSFTLSLAESGFLLVGSFCAYRPLARWRERDLVF
jgi:hypothetical protein